MTKRLPVLLLCALCATCGDSTGPSDRTDRMTFASTQAEGDWEIWSVMPDGSKPLRLTRSPGVDIQPSLSSDRRFIAFYSERTPRGIYIMNADGSELRLLCQVHEGAEQLDWSPDDRFIVFESFITGLGRGIYVVDVASGQPTLIRADASAPDWSPDGTTIAFHEGFPPRIYVMEPDGSNVRLLIASAADPAFSPNGTLLAFVNGDRDGIAVASSLDGSGRHVVNGSTVLGAADQGPTWSRNGARIAFTRTEIVTANIYSVRADGTDLRQVTTSGGNNGGVTW